MRVFGRTAARFAAFPALLLALSAHGQTTGSIDYVNLTEVPDTPGNVTAGVGLSGISLAATCSACVSAATTSGGLGNFNFSLTAGGGFPVAAGIVPVTGTTLDSEGVTFSSGNVTINGSNSLLSAAITGATVFATPNLATPSQVTVQFDLSGATSSVIGALPSTTYLIVTGTDPDSVPTESIGGITTFTQLQVDWSADLSNTPFNPVTSGSSSGGSSGGSSSGGSSSGGSSSGGSSSGGSSSGGSSSGGGTTKVPEPATLGLMGLGMLGAALARRRSRR
jgi:hypothetical protein